MTGLAAFLISPVTHAAESAHYFDTFFGNAAVNPGTPTPWLVLNFRDDLAPNSVFLTISNSSLLPTSAKLGEVDLNLNPAMNATGLTFTVVSSSGGFALPTISKGTDLFKVGGDGKYDINFAFTTGMDGSTTFTKGEWVTYKITGLAGLDSSDFNFLSAPGNGGDGPFFSAGHLLGLGNGQKSAWIAPSGIIIVPEPPPIALLSVGLSLLIVGRRTLRRG